VTHICIVLAVSVVGLSSLLFIVLTQNTVSVLCVTLAVFLRLLYPWRTDRYIFSDVSGEF